MKGLGCVKEKQMPGIFPLCVFFSSQFEVCKCITLVSRPCVCDCNEIGRVASCLYQRNGEEEEHMKQRTILWMSPWCQSRFLISLLTLLWDMVLKVFPVFVSVKRKQTNKQGFMDKKESP